MVRPGVFGFSADSRQVAVPDADLSIGVFDLATAKRVQRLAPVWPCRARLFSTPMAGQLALDLRGAVQVRDLQTGKVLWQQPLLRRDPVARVASRRKILAVGESMPSGDVISLWDVAAGKRIGKMEGMQGSGIRCAFNHAGTLLASTGWGGILRLWDPLTSRQLFSTFASGTITPQFSQDDHFLAATARREHACVFGRSPPAMSTGPSRRTPWTAKDGMSAPTSARMAVCSQPGREGVVGLWDLPSGKKLAFLEGLPGLNFVLLETLRALLTMGSNGLFRRPIRREPVTGVVQLGAPEKLPVPGVANAFAQSQDGRVLASAQFQGAVVLHADQPDRLINLGPHEDARSVAVSPNGQWVATGGFGYPGGAKVWDARSRKLEKDLPVGSYCQVVFSPDGKRLLTDAGVLHP